MPVIRSLSLVTILTVAVAAPTIAQFGHPLKGSWSGDWGPTADQRTRVLIELDWNGETLIGTINPGPAAVPLSKATLDPSTWTLQLEAEAKDAAGRPIRYLISGKLENLGAFRRFITGTWIEGDRKGTFKIVRN